MVMTTMTVMKSVIPMLMNSLNWLQEPPRVKRGKKDILKEEAKLRFKPKSVLDCFDNFMPQELKQLIIDYTNLNGE